MPSKYNVFTNNFDLVDSLDGLVVGPAISTDNAVARYDGTTGTLLQNSGVIVDDSSAVTGVTSLTLAAGAAITEFSTDGTLSGDSDNAVPTEKAVKTYVDSVTPTVSYPPLLLYFPASRLELVETNSAVPGKLSGTNKKKNILAFSDSTEQYANGSFYIPDRIDTAGTATIRYVVQAKTFVASKNIALTFGHSAVADDEDYDTAYTDVDTGDEAVGGEQDDELIIEDTATIASLGWVAGDEVDFRVSRPSASANNLADDLYIHSVTVILPIGA